MKAQRQYTKYLLVEGDFALKAKIGDKGVTFQNISKTNSGVGRWLAQRDFAAAENAFIFKQSSPEMIENFAKAFKIAAKLAREEGLHEV